MLGQRLIAVLLTVLLFLLIIFGSVAIFRALDHPGWGWFVGIGFCVSMVLGFVVQNRRSS